MSGKSLFEKVWEDHLVSAETPSNPAVLYIDLHLAHEVTTPQAFTLLREQGLPVRRPDLTLATLDHSTPTVPVGSLQDLDVLSEPAQAAQIRQMAKNCADFGIELHGFGSDQRGIVHVIGPEIGATQPGKTIVCGDSHSSTHGAFGALAFGIGSTEVGHVLATQCLLQRKPMSMAINFNGRLPVGVTAKDIILATIGEIGVNGGTGHVIEYRGNVISNLSMEERMTICNMTIEAGARAGMMAPDNTTVEFLAGRPQAPVGADWDSAVTRWLSLPSDDDAGFDREIDIDVTNLQPMVTFGTNPGMVVPVTDPVPDGNGEPSFRKALDYMGLESGQPMQQTSVDIVFVGSCTNSRLPDLRTTARVLKGRKVADSVRMLVVPGSEIIKQQAEAEGLHEIFLAAGAEWREAGCSMCLGMNGDNLQPGQLCVSTSNRNFEGRQGIGGRTVLASPETAAASAVNGHITDPRTML
ncbi:MAG: 3-isopropylmalate dehydratase large subunit [Gammaproteobacteria bacterium]|jgi:3-isopropylmalate/(R)-2-methylmalate dehydratase large subunit|nr:3-isopropylmalate dehydratase large subunit [Chromatiales bacterium]MCP4926059.1 3-isopropylmalate dehydratase large subunit [Gammaproteobacteria bacterium]MDP7296228.1 3-isopropylmalate dehydratase large subunit [Gammaproteobacteria bacterium]MDP7419485.1 3-isopropylmalate dehydratase large subunit [Gammaproteobacteria bacterium]MDP7661319.1 3-isopropylmalate dehydratase large subunit [Gammaproteobacteria bacterium]